MRLTYALPYALGLAMLSSALAPSVAEAQVIPNGLGSAISAGDQSCQANCVITGGSHQQSNLFHSFSKFSIPQGSTVTLQHNAAVQNIFLRVTDAASYLDGRLSTEVGGSLGTADLFFLNPHGVVFGPNASLQLGGSFLASTADRIQFADGVEFVVQEPQPLLSVNVPVGLQLAANAGAIEVGTATAPGPGNGLFLNGNFSLNRSNRPDGLAVAQGEALALIGNGINMVGGNLTAPQGQIELGSVQPLQQIALEPQGQSWTLQYADSTLVSDINLSQAASVDVSGNGSGQVQLRGKTIDLTEGAVIVADTLGNGMGGQVEVAAQTLNIQGLSIVAPPAPPPQAFPAYSGILANVAPGQLGSGGSVNLETQALNVAGGAQINALTFGSGSGGNLSVQADDVLISGGTPFGPSSLSVATVGDTGKAGSLELQSETLRLEGGGALRADTFGDGQAGNLIVNSDFITVTGANPGGPSVIGSVSNVPFSAGAGGNVQISGQSISVLEGGQISTATIAAADAGQLSIQATESLEISGRSPFLPRGRTEQPRGGLFSTAILGSGRAGDISIETPNLILQNGGIISVSNFLTFDGPPPGTGPSGTIRLDVGELAISNDAGLDARTNFDGSGSGGANIEVTADSVLLQNNSFITASAEGSADGGNVTIQTQLLVAPPQSNSDITARALSGQGGNINISSEGLLGFILQPALDGNTSNDIDASSQAGVNGTVSTTGLDADSKVVSPQIPAQPSDASQLIGNACNGPSKLGGQFIITGRGGLPPTPEDIRVDFTPLADPVTDSIADASQPTSERPAELASAFYFREAQGWQRIGNNRIVLMAEHTEIASASISAACL